MNGIIIFVGVILILVILFCIVTSRLIDRLINGDP